VRYAADSITRRGTQKAYATEAEFEVFCRAHGETPAIGEIA
jgi:ribokinase